MPTPSCRQTIDVINQLPRAEQEELFSILRRRLAEPASITRADQAARIDALSNPACSVLFDADVPCVVMEWHGYGTTPQFRQISENVLKLLVEKGVSKVVADTTHLPIISGDDQRWLNDDWLPRAIQAGYRACGMVNSRFYFNRVAVDNVVRRVKKDQFQVEYFDSQAAAKEWLRSLSV